MTEVTEEPKPNVFIERSNGVMMGYYSHRIEGVAEEEVPYDHPDVIAFNAAKEANQ